MKKQEKGITLIALIITIIVLLILAVVAIGAVQNDGIIGYAKESKQEYQAAQTNEQTELDKYLEEIESHGSSGISMLEGDGQTYYTLAPTALSFRSSANIKDFQEVQINGETIDQSNYTMTEGSTIINLSIDYLKNLAEDDYSISIVSKTGSPSARFSVIEPDVNNHGFYYNQPYTAYIDSFQCNVTIFPRENGKCDIITYVEGESSHSVENATYTISNNNVIANTSLGNLDCTLYDEGMSLYYADMDVKFTIGDESIVADGDYVYIYDNVLGGYVVDVIEENKPYYSPIKTGINGLPTVKMYKYIFDNNKKMTNMPQIPQTITSINFSAFSYSGLIKAEIPNHIITIEEYAFDNSYDLSILVISDSVTSIGEGAFSNCTSLTQITYEGTMEQWNQITLGEEWNSGVPATTIKCKDGNVSLN